MAQEESKARRGLSEIDAEIAQVKKELEDARGTPSEVYARIVGYYRSVKNWNAGKREEYGERKLFKQDNPRAGEMCACGNEAIAGARKGAEAKA